MPAPISSTQQEADDRDLDQHIGVLLRTGVLL